MRELWRWWTESWRAPGRARGVYLIMALGFGALAVVGALAADALVASIAGAVAVVTFALAVVAPRLASWTDAAHDSESGVHHE